MAKPLQVFVVQAVESPTTSCVIITPGEQVSAPKKLASFCGHCDSSGSNPFFSLAAGRLKDKGPSGACISALTVYSKFLFL